MLYVRFEPNQHPLAVAEVSVNFIVDASALSVIFENEKMFQTVPDDVIIHVPEPMVSVLVFELLEENDAHVTSKSFASNVPLVRVNVLVEPSVRSSASWNVPPTPLQFIGRSIVTELLVIVFVPEVAVRFMVPLPEPTVIPVPSVRFPLTMKETLLPANVPVNPVKSRSLQSPPVKVNVPVPAETLR